MMRLYLVLLFLPYVVMASDEMESLERIDFYGEWHSDWVAFKDEKQILNISNDLSSSFIRQFNSTEPQSFASTAINAEINQDVLILKFGGTQGPSYKLVLSGWKLEHMKKLYGTMFMYRDGKQFNGVPVSFVIDNE